MEELKIPQGIEGLIGDDLIITLPELEPLRDQRATAYWRWTERGLELTLYVNPDCHEDKGIDPINGWVILLGGHGFRFDWEFRIDEGPKYHWPTPESTCGCYYMRQLDPERFENDKIAPGYEQVDKSKSV